MAKKKKKLNEVEEIKSEFIAVASHKMRTPLSAVKWYVESLLNGDAGKLSKEQESFVKQIFLNNRRLINFLDDLLRVAKVEEGKIKLKKEPVNLDCLIGETVKKAKKEIIRKKINFSYRESEAEVRGDPDKLKRIFFDLLDNAIKYNSVGGKVSVEVVKRDKEYVCAISDTGVGIPARNQKMIFTKFFRANNVVTMHTEGNGLSLYLAKAYIESHGGKIWVDSRVGRGSTFYFTLPIK